jgi:pimeloyl-ACP methyl ester carboxylesterase
VGRPWGFELGEIRVPVLIWQGTADPMVPERHADELAARIPGARLVKWPGEGHLAPVAHIGELLDAMAAGR